MANEKEVREGRSRNTEPLCSVTGRTCECLAGGGCKALQPKLDKVPTPTVRSLRAARLLFEAALVHVHEACGEEQTRRRQFPGPECRDIRRKAIACINMIDDIGGEL